MSAFKKLIALLLCVLMLSGVLASCNGFGNGATGTEPTDSTVAASTPNASEPTPSEPTPSEPTPSESTPSESTVHSDPTEDPTEPEQAPSEVPETMPSEEPTEPDEPTEAPNEPTEVPNEPTEAPDEPTDEPIYSDPTDPDTPDDEEPEGEAGIDRYSDLGGYEYRAFVRSKNAGSSHFPCVDFWVAEDFASSVLDHAVYERNLAIEAAYNCKIVQVDSQTAEMYDEMVTFYKNGEAFELSIILAEGAAVCATMGLLRDLRALDHVVLSNTAYDQSSIEQLSVGEKLYFLSGDMNVSTLDQSAVTVFDRNLFESYDFPALTGKEAYGDLYQMVENGTWTVDAMLEMASVVNHDADQSGGTLDATAGDRVGYYLYSASPQYYFYGCGARVSETSQETGGYPSIVFGEADAREVYHFLYARLNVAEKHPEMPTGGSGLRTNYFATGNTLFTDALVWDVRSIYRKKDVTYGVLPIPKYSAGQERYFDIVYWPYNMAWLWSIPTVCESPEYASFLFNVMAVYSARAGSTMDTFLDSTLDSDHAENEAARRVMRVIRDSLTYDLSLLYDWGAFLSGALEHMEVAEEDPYDEGTTPEALDTAKEQMNTIIDAIRNPVLPQKPEPPVDPDDDPIYTDPVGAVGIHRYSDLEGYRYRALVRSAYSGSGLHCEDFWVAEDSATNVLAHAVYERNLAIEATYNCQIVQVDSQTLAMYDEMVTFYKNGEALELSILNALDAPTAATAGLLRDLRTLDHVVLSNTAYDQSSIEQLGVGEKLYFLSGDMNVSSMDSAAVTVFNRALLAGYDFPALTGKEAYGDLYQMVENGTWTVDAMLEMASVVNHDADQSGGTLDATKGDTVGYFEHSASPQYYFYGCGARVSETSQETGGYPSIVFGEADAREVYHFLYARLNVAAKHPEMPTGGSGLRTNYFATGNTLFTDALVWEVRKIYRKKDAFTYGVLPIPKYSAGQTRYFDVVYWPYGPSFLWSVPTVCENPEYASFLFNVMAVYSARAGGTMDAFLDSTPDTDHAENEAARRVMRVIHDSLTYDVATVYDWGAFLCGALEHMEVAEEDPYDEGTTPEILDAARGQVNGMIDGFLNPTLPSS